MRTLAIIALALPVVTGCTAQAVPRTSLTPKETSSVAAAGLAVANGWQAGEMQFSAEPGSSEVGPRRQGTTRDGWVYTYYQDGSASVEPRKDSVMEGWSIHCLNDAMTDKRKCSIRSSSARLEVSYIGSKTPTSVCIIGHDFPGKVGAVRIDQSEPISTNQQGCLAGSIATKIAKSKTFTTRHVEWPYDETNDKQSSSAGLASAMELMAFLEAHRGKLSFF